MGHPGNFRLLHRLRVRWAEVDMQSIVFNAHYLAYLDVAITEYWRAAALPFAQTMTHLNGDMVVRKASIDFLRSARMDDWLHIGLRHAKTGRSSLVFEGAIFRGNELLATGELLYVFTTPRAQASQAVPTALVDVLQAFEGGLPMTSLQSGSWAALQAHAMPLRQQVLGQELGLPSPLLSDAADDHAFHAVITNRLGLAVAAGRVACLGTVAQVGRMAVCHALRHQGLGQRVMQALLAHARTLQCTQAKLDAVHGTEHFYQARGFVPCGSVFEEAGIAHQTMVLALVAGNADTN